MEIAGNPFEVVSFSSDQMVSDESMGTKPKYWFVRNDERWLFKVSRENTGEDWSEKLSAEVASLVGVPHARVELAEYNGVRGSASLSFVNPKDGTVLMHGNELLGRTVTGYDQKLTYHQKLHTLDNIFSSLIELFELPPEMHTVKTAIQQQVVAGWWQPQLAGYFVLDALVGNTDRHHENWGVLLKLVPEEKGGGRHMQVAPSFDHASSLGRELQDQKREQILRDGRIDRYTNKATGGIYLQTDNNKGARLLDVVAYGVEKFPNAFIPALNKVKAVPINDIAKLVDLIPSARMSGLAKSFAKAVLTENYRRLVEFIP